MIQINNLRKTFHGGKVAVDDLSFAVNDGEIVGFIGPNGAGKTTTIKMMTGILKPDSGVIKVNDVDISKNPIEAKKIIGYIADSPDMFLKLTGMEFIQFISDVYNVPVSERAARIEEFTKKFDLEDILSDKMQSYSHGTRQKLQIIAALVHAPAVWILDEPLTGLDPKSAYNLKAMMREHADKGNSVLFSTHVLEVAEKLCDKVIIITHGHDIFYGTLDELTAKYPGKDLEQIFLELTGDEKL